MSNEYKKLKTGEIRCKSIVKKLLWPSWEERKRLVLLEIWSFVMACYVLITFSYLFPQDFPNTSTFYVVPAWIAFLFRTFLFHVGLVIAFILVFEICIKRRDMVFVTLPLLFITLGPLAGDFLPKSQPDAMSETLKVMSMNLLMINKETDMMISEIKMEEPDILLLQEYTSHWHSALTHSLGTLYKNRCYDIRSDSFGAAIYSKLPFQGDINKFIPLSQQGLPQLRVVITFDNRKVVLYNIHLIPPRRLDYTVLHRLQFANLMKILSDETLPVILSGDFNFTPRSPQAGELGKLGYRDCHSVVGWGLGNTWPINAGFEWLPGLRLDHVWITEDLECTGCKTGFGHGSDHKPIIVHIQSQFSS